MPQAGKTKKEKSHLLVLFLPSVLLESVCQNNRFWSATRCDVTEGANTCLCPVADLLSHLDGHTKQCNPINQAAQRRVDIQRRL